MSSANAGNDFGERGFALYQQMLTPCDLRMMDDAFPILGKRVPGARADAFTPEMQAWLASRSRLLGLAGDLLQAPACLSRIQVFDKSADANWFVPWHQDRAEDSVERDLSRLERTVALRVHLDHCDEENGPLLVLPGSHLSARLTAESIAQRVATTTPVVCLAGRGDILAIRPLLVHCSRRARKAVARRVLHLEFSASSAI